MNIASDLKINFIYKTSFDKANRTSLHGKRGIGLENSLNVFKKIKDNLKIPVITDVHDIEQCKIIAEVVDVIQREQGPKFQKVVTELMRAKGIKIVLHSIAVLGLDDGDDRLNITPDIIEILNQDSES